MKSWFSPILSFCDFVASEIVGLGGSYSVIYKNKKGDLVGYRALSRVWVKSFFWQILTLNWIGTFSGQLQHPVNEV